MKAILLLTILAASPGAWASETVPFRDGEIQFESGRLSLKVQGKSKWTFKLKNAHPSQGGHISIHELGAGTTAIHVTYTTGEGKDTEAVFIGETNRKLKLIWNEDTTLIGDLGERIGQDIRFVDLTGDKMPEIVIGWVKETVRLCGQKEPPLLFRKVYDRKSRRFKSVLARRPGLKANEDIHGANRSDFMAPLIRHITPRAASRMAGDQGNPHLLASPGAIADQNSQTAWIPIPGNGAGEFTTMDVLTDAYGITAIGIASFRYTRPKKRVDSPKSILLTTSKKTYRLRFREQPEGTLPEMVWFAFDDPIRTECLSLIIESSFDSGPRTSLGLSEVTVLTEADGPDGLDGVARDLLRESTRRHAARILDRAGERAVPALRSVWDRLDWQGKKSALTIIANRAPRLGADILVNAAIEGIEAFDPVIRKGLQAAGDAAVDHLEPLLESERTREFKVAVNTLQEIGSRAALTRLCAHAGRGDRERRAHIRARLTLAVQQLPVDPPWKAEFLWTEIERADENGETERTLDLMRSAVGVEALQAGVLDLSTRLYVESNQFADRYRLLEIMGSHGCSAPLSILVEASKDKDKYIRTAAQMALGTCKENDSVRREAAVAALMDPEPTVRIAALNAMVSSGFSKYAPKQIGKLAMEDEWTDVRIRSVANCRHLRPELVTEILVRTQIDPAEGVRAQTIKSAIPIPGRRVDRLIESRLKDPNERPKVKRLAAEAAGFRCQETALPHLFESLKKGAEPLASDLSIQVAQAAAKAMGNIGTKQALTSLEAAKKRSNPATHKAINAALKAKKRRCR